MLSLFLFYMTPVGQLSELAVVLKFDTTGGKNKTPRFIVLISYFYSLFEINFRALHLNKIDLITSIVCVCERGFDIWWCPGFYSEFPQSLEEKREEIMRSIQILNPIVCPQIC